MEAGRLPAPDSPHLLFLQAPGHDVANVVVALVGGGWGNLPAEHLARDALGQAVDGNEREKCSFIGLQACEAVMYGLNGLAPLSGSNRVGAAILSRDFGCGGLAGRAGIGAGVGEEVLSGLADQRNETALGLRLAVHQAEKGLLRDFVGEFRVAALRLAKLDQHGPEGAVQRVNGPHRGWVAAGSVGLPQLIRFLG